MEIYRKNKSKGWGVIAKEAGIKPGSPEFQALKNSASEKVKKGKGNGGNKANKGKRNRNYTLTCTYLYPEY